MTRNAHRTRIRRRADCDCMWSDALKVSSWRRDPVAREWHRENSDFPYKRKSDFVSNRRVLPGMLPNVTVVAEFVQSMDCETCCGDGRRCRIVRILTYSC